MNIAAVLFTNNEKTRDSCKYFQNTETGDEKPLRRTEVLSRGLDHIVPWQMELSDHGLVQISDQICQKAIDMISREVCNPQMLGFSQDYLVSNFG